MNRKLIYIVVIVVCLVVVLHYLTKDLLLTPVQGKISSPFGNRTHPISGEYGFHNGIDIAAPEGTPVKAPFSGQVATVYYNSKGGKQVVLERKDGFKAGFAHLSSVIVKTGDTVKTGQVFAYVGSTGSATGSHLHFTVKDKKGKYIDPAKLMI